MIAPIKLAQFLLQLCAKGQRTESGVLIQCPFTNDQLGLYLGLSLETVHCCFDDLTGLRLIEQRGSTFVVSDLRALEVFAGQQP